MLSRKDRAKRKYLKSKQGKHLRNVVKARGVSLDQVTDTVLPDDFKFDGVKVVDGEFCRTAAQYKAAIAKKYGK